MWLMQTPERVEELPSPPYIVMKDEEVNQITMKSKSELLAPVSTMKALRPFYDILEASINLRIDNSNNINVIDKHCSQEYHVITLDFNEIAKEQDRAFRFFNQHLVNHISRDRESPYLDCWEVTACLAQQMRYLTTNRDISLKDMMKCFPREE